MKYEINTTAEQDAALSEVVAWRNAALTSADPDATLDTNLTFLQGMVDEEINDFMRQVAADAEHHLLLKYRAVPQEGKAAIEAVAAVEADKGIPALGPLGVADPAVIIGERIDP